MQYKAGLFKFILDEIGCIALVVFWNTTNKYYIGYIPSAMQLFSSVFLHSKLPSHCPLILPSLSVSGLYSRRVLPQVFWVQSSGLLHLRGDLSLLHCLLLLSVKAASLPSNTLSWSWPLMHSPKRLLTSPLSGQYFTFQLIKTWLINKYLEFCG